MGNWSLVGVSLILGLFLLIFGFILAQITIDNPLTGVESSIWSIILGWIL